MINKKRIAGLAAAAALTAGTIAMPPSVATAVGGGGVGTDGIDGIMSCKYERNNAWEVWKPRYKIYRGTSDTYQCVTQKHYPGYHLIDWWYEKRP